MSPLTRTTLLKIACLQQSGAKLTVTNPSFMQETADTIKLLQQEGINYRPLPQVSGSFDFLLDCQYEATQSIVELTRTGAMRYEHYQDTKVPIVSVDSTQLKSLEACLGTNEGVYRAITQFSSQALNNKALLVFGFGKVGTGIAYYFSKIIDQISVVGMLPQRLSKISSRGHNAISGELPQQVKQ